jgi:RNA polymerase sigma factor (sigma-70 family)
LIPDEDIVLSSTSWLSKIDDKVAWENASDSQLIEACLAGEEAAWVVLLQRYSRLVYTIPLRFGFSKTVADEIFQETCLILLEGLNSLQQKDRIRSWLVTVCRRVCIQHLRQKKEDQSLDGMNVDGRFPPIDSELIKLEQQHVVQEALTNLSPRCQELLKALFFATPPASYEEISQKFDIPTGSIGPTRTRCLEKLEQELIKLGHQ